MLNKKKPARHADASHAGGEKKEDKTVGEAVLSDTLKAIQTKFGEGAIMKFGNAPKVDVNVIPTGSIGLDMALGVGGIPRGRIIEIFGPESSGKTTLSLHIVGEAQKLGGVCAYIDAEHAMDPDYTKKLGVNINDLLISQRQNPLSVLMIQFGKHVIQKQYWLPNVRWISAGIRQIFQLSQLQPQYRHSLFTPAAVFRNIFVIITPPSPSYGKDTSRRREV
ncbi:MAG: Protein RecA, partial [Candidatus Nomurabacteria bacterium GW2011_GWF1_42_40]